MSRRRAKKIIDRFFGDFLEWLGLDVDELLKHSHIEAQGFIFSYGMEIRPSAKPKRKVRGKPVKIRVK